MRVSPTYFVIVNFQLNWWMHYKLGGGGRVPPPQIRPILSGGNPNFPKTGWVKGPTTKSKKWRPPPTDSYGMTHKSR